VSRDVIDYVTIGLGIWFAMVSFENILLARMVAELLIRSLDHPSIFLLKMHYGGANRTKYGTPDELDLSFRAPNDGAKFRQN